MNRTSLRLVLKGSSTVSYAFLTCTVSYTLAKEAQLFPRHLGLYSGIFAMYYLQSPSKKSGTAITLFYAVCLLYVLSTATFVSDLVALIFFVSNDSIL